MLNVEFALRAPTAIPSLTASVAATRMEHEAKQRKTASLSAALAGLTCTPSVRAVLGARYIPLEPSPLLACEALPAVVFKL